MEVTPIAATLLFRYEAEKATDFKWSPDFMESDADCLAEFAGRSCYQSWDRPNPATRANRDYLGHVIENQDFSIYEHGTVTFYVTGVSRSFSHQMIRHRHVSPSQLSQRYVNEANRSEPVIPEALQNAPGTEILLRDFYNDAMNVYAQIVERLQNAGLTRKEARDAARAVLPNSQETRLVLTANHRAWREFIGKRKHYRASDEIAEFAGHVLRHLKNFAPNTYQDFPDDEPDGTGITLKAVA
ncbi:FAD-dependent thymidylate synthase [Streptosporangium sp. OZ121]|uniref:FAD-dependent thymidylate synthase n=1 Tax=Streptosporangium sp. OZ121 TaxID=3444183 RepID=UPI003F79B372